MDGRVLMSLLERTCPKCKEVTVKFYLMMTECDDCISKNRPKELEPKYILKNGIFVKNPNA